MTPPVVKCPGDFTEYVSPGVTSAEVFYDEPTATDNGGQALVLTQSHEPGDTFPFGSTRISYSFGDPDGNIAPDCIFYVFVTGKKAVTSKGSKEGRTNYYINLNAQCICRFGVGLAV